MSLIQILKWEDIPSIRAIPSARSLFKDKKEDFALCLLVLALLVYSSADIVAYFFAIPEYTEDQMRHQPGRTEQ